MSQCMVKSHSHIGSLKDCFWYVTCPEDSIIYRTISMCQVRPTWWSWIGSKKIDSVILKWLFSRIGTVVDLSSVKFTSYLLFSPFSLLLCSFISLYFISRPETSSLQLLAYLSLLFFTVDSYLYNMGSNDGYDFDTGADKNKKESVVNLVGSRTRTLIAAYLLLVLGFMGLTWASVEAGSMRSMLLLASAITCGYVYQCPPFRLSYQGLGEPLCFAAFGPFATTAFYLLQSSASKLPITGTILSASFLVGLTTTLILFCSHFHQINEDRPVGKMSPLVRFGTKTGSEIVKLAVIALYSLLFAFGICRALPFTSIFLCALTLPVGKLVVSFVMENHKDKTKIFMAKYFCVRLHAIFGAALAAGLVASRLITRRLVAVNL